jgi:hypothetical protein
VDAASVVRAFGFAAGFFAAFLAGRAFAFDVDFGFALEVPFFFTARARLARVDFVFAMLLR